jgi:hypothetical protein
MGYGRLIIECVEGGYSASVGVGENAVTERAETIPDAIRLVTMRAIVDGVGTHR